MQNVTIHPKLILAYTEVSDGNMDERYSDRSVIMSNRRKIYNQFELNPRLVIEGKQIHSDRVLVLNEENTKMWVGNNIPGVDGFITDQAEAGLLLKLADCVPVIIYDPVRHALGIAHVGWQGAIKQIHLKTLTLLQANYETDPSKVLVWLGPSAQKGSYTSEKEPDQIKDPAWKPFIERKKGLYYIDLQGFIVAGFKQAGVKAKQIQIDPKDTVTDQTLYSHSRAKANNTTENRFLLVAKLR